jgi:hypothetical protein
MFNRITHLVTRILHTLGRDNRTFRFAGLDGSCGLASEVSAV